MELAADQRINESTNPPAKRVCLGMPGYGLLTAEAGRALWRASQGALAPIPLAVSVTYQQGSLLAANFNALWCWALNADREQPVSYFAMLHEDVAPDDWWLDLLVAELEARGLDVLGAVVPIKDPKGVTSLALARADRDPWRPLCRLTMHEIHRLPETFTSDDLGHPLLLNTGCWVAKFNPAWASKVCFTINDRIVVAPDGRYRVEVEPEDWFFSRLCHELGLKVGATRKLGIEHAGRASWTNRCPWGTEEFDGAYLKESVVPEGSSVQCPVSSVQGSALDTQHSTLNFPHDVDGWLTRVEGEALAELARGKHVVEIGSYCGRSTICLAQTAAEVVALDFFDGRGTPNPRNTRDDFWRNLTRYGVRDTVRTLDPSATLPAGAFDLVFVDGAHDVTSVRQDILSALSWLTPAGLIAFHDYRQFPGEHDGNWDPGVTHAVNELLASGAELVSRHGTIAVVRPESRDESPDPESPVSSVQCPEKGTLDTQHSTLNTRLILGLGTGRCGTRSLAQLLAAQPGCDAGHERHPLRWCGEENPAHWIEEALDGVQSPESRVQCGESTLDTGHGALNLSWADVGFYYLPHVERLLEWFPQLVCVCLKRDRAETIRSFCDQLPRAQHWFDDHRVGWSRSFPVYRCPFPEAAGRYWDDYYARAAQLEEEYRERFRVFDTAVLNDPAGVEELLRFAGFDDPVVTAGIRVTGS